MYQLYKMHGQSRECPKRRQKRRRRCAGIKKTARSEGEYGKLFNAVVATVRLPSRQKANSTESAHFVALATETLTCALPPTEVIHQPASRCHPTSIEQLRPRAMNSDRWFIVRFSLATEDVALRSISLRAAERRTCSCLSFNAHARLGEPGAATRRAFRRLAQFVRRKLKTTLATRVLQGFNQSSVCVHGSVFRVFLSPNLFLVRAIYDHAHVNEIGGRCSVSMRVRR